MSAAATPTAPASARTLRPRACSRQCWSAIDRHATALLWGAIIVYVVAFAILSSLKLAWLRQGFDIAGNEQVIWNTLHGRPFRTSIFAFMQYDFDDGPVLLELPLALLYGIHQSPYTLLALQTLALGLAAWPIFLLGRDTLAAPWQALALALIYLLHPTTQHINMYEFQLRSFMIPFAMGALLFLRRGRLAAVPDLPVADAVYQNRGRLRAGGVRRVCADPAAGLAVCGSAAADWAAVGGDRTGRDCAALQPGRFHHPDL